jgi:hypothetical protein
MVNWFSFRSPFEKAPMRGEEKEGVPTEKSVEKVKALKGIQGLKIIYVPKGMWFREITKKIGKKDTKMMTLEIPESGLILEPGKPMLPIEGLFVALPAEAESVNFKVEKSETIEYPGKIQIIPAPEPTKDEAKKYDWQYPTYKPDNTIYQSDEEYPKDLFKLSSISYVGNVQVAHLLMYPLHYKAKSQKLIIYNKIELKAEYTLKAKAEKGGVVRGIAPKKGAKAAKAVKAVEPVGRAPRVQQEYKNQILNMEEFKDVAIIPDDKKRRSAKPKNPQKLADPANKGRFVVITTEDLAPVLPPLAKLKEAKGMSAQIVTTKQIYEEFQDPKEEQNVAIRDFILYAYDKWQEPPEFIIMVGEIQKMPTHMNPEFNCPSDWFYANLIGDISPDICVGRIAINDADKLKNYIEKIAMYEKEGGALINRVLLTTFEREDYISCSDDIANMLKTVKDVKIIKKYGGQSTKEEVIKEIEEGCGVINYRGHGSEYEWQASNGLGVADTPKLKNKDKIAVVFSIACLNNAVDVPDECFGESFVEAPFGAVVFVGASRPSYTAPNHHFDRYIWRAIIEKKMRVVGKIFNFACSELFRNFPDAYTKENLAMYLLLGDPSLEIKFPIVK